MTTGAQLLGAATPDNSADWAYHAHVRRCAMHLHVIPLQRKVFIGLRNQQVRQITTRTEPTNTRLLIDLTTGETRAIKD